jgi:hypothetical protein
MSDIIEGDRTEAERKAEHQMPKAARKGPDKPWVVDVDVYLEDIGPPVEFHIDSSLPVDGGNLVFYNRHRPGFTINFRLWDNTAEGNYVFPNPPAPPNNEEAWALWSSKGKGCPPPCSSWSVFSAQSVKDQGLTLVVRNLNDSMTEFGYTLRVTNNGGDTFVELDPGGNNMNGSSSNTGSN